MTCIRILTNRKPEHRRGKVQLIDASSMWQKMRKSLGSKRKELSEEHIAKITRLFGECQEVWLDENGKPVSRKALAAGSSSAGSSATPSKAKPKTPAASALPLSAVPISRIFKNEDFGYRTITVERPERAAAGKVVKETKGKGKGKPKPDTSLRDTENVPLSDDVEDYFKREVLPHVPDAWIDHEKTKTGYEIPFNRHFYVFKPPRELAANATMILTYWDIGQMIAQRQEVERWGASVIPRLAVDLKNELPEEKGFSPRILGNMVRFFREYGIPTNLQHTAAKSGSPEVAGNIERASASSLPSIEDIEAELSQDLAEDES